MKRIVLLLTFCCSSVWAQSQRNVRPLTAEASQKWVIRWDRSDDFNDRAIDWRKWNRRPENFGAWTWDNASNASVSDGVLAITVRRVAQGDERPREGENREGSKPSPFTSAMLKSYATGTYGYYEARIKGASVFPGVCPAFWLYSRIDDSLTREGDVRYSEVDVVELTQRGEHVPGNVRITDHNLHTILSNGHKGVAGRQWQRPELFKDDQANEYKAPFDPRGDFHTYGCMVNQREIVWYVDGSEVGRKKNRYWHRKMHVALSLGLRAPYARFENNRLVPTTEPPAGELPTSMLVDYVRVWELSDRQESVISGIASTCEAPHGKGNVYAADIVRHKGELMMYYGGQGRDGHDRIHLAISADGKTWNTQGVVFAPEGVNHVNDPSLAVVDDELYMYYTRASAGVTDCIGLATSTDGRKWLDHGAVISPREKSKWDSLLVGRPSVIHDGRMFRLWFDGRADLPPGAPDPTAPKSVHSQRHVGYAESKDGKSWIRRDKCVFGNDAGGVHVSHVDGRLVMLTESRDGTKWASSNDGILWKDEGVLVGRDRRTSPHGHVTPFLLADGDKLVLYFGAAKSEHWNQNSIMRVAIPSLGHANRGN